MVIKQKLPLTQKRSEGLNAGIANRTLLISFLNQISEQINVIDPLTLDTKPEDNIKIAYLTMKKELTSNSRKTVNLMVKGKQIDKISDETDDLFELYNFNTAGRNTYANVLTVLEEIYQNYEVLSKE